VGSNDSECIDRKQLDALIWALAVDEDMFTQLKRMVNRERSGIEREHSWDEQTSNPHSVPGRRKGMFEDI
jgi:hypothetical protein